MTKLEAARRERKLTQAALGRKARVAQPDVSAIERRRVQPWPEHAKRLARVLGLSPDELTDEVASAA